ncbi:hypothetical protein [Sphingobacterium hungaricum]|uniref:Uncharacterized protein n=1 Tax=Sphingobacterium hungaricum TaxID=2082723 RepID=A0A928UUX5_9SPHI|nr:hypothetical protein [Sphingobacterium hungaricum]MBE8713680.1 hypothetical protein [Sphingobacterium hungaricum]
MRIGNKRIIFGAPQNSGFSDVIRKELINLGYIIEDFSIKEEVFEYKSIFQRLYNLYRKVIFNDYDYKKKLKKEAHKNRMLDQLQKIPRADYAFFIRPDFFPLEFIAQVRNKADRSIAYQWDGLNRYPGIENYIPHFDRFYVFDPEDLSYPNTYPTTNFYFDSFKSIEVIDYKKAYFIGSFEAERMDNIVAIRNQLTQLNYECTIIIYSPHTRQTYEIKKFGFTHIDKHINYYENLNSMMSASVLIDIQNPIHKGLSFRIFESLGYDKKVITTNQNVVHYDLFHPNNIFVLNNYNAEDLISFLNTPYVQIADRIKKKYSFTNWANYVLDNEQYLPIDLPIIR